MKSMQVRLAKWVGALAIAALAPLAHAIPVGDFTGPPGFKGIPLGTVNGATSARLNIPVSGLVVGQDYEFYFEFANEGANFSNSDLEVSFGNFPPQKDLFPLFGIFTAAKDTEFWRFFLDSSLDTSQVDIRGARIVCQAPCAGGPISNVPEPGTLMLVGAAMLAGAAIRRRKSA